MAEVLCSRCQSVGPGLDRAPLPGSIGRLVLDQVCGACWQDWLREQVKVINERRLLPANPEHYLLLVTEMRRHLGLSTDEPEPEP